MRPLLGLCILLSLVGCAGTNLTQSGINATAATSIAGGIASVVTGNPLTGVAVGAVSGVAADFITPEPKPELPDLSELPEEDRASYLKQLTVASVIEKIGLWVILATLAGLTVIPAIIGYLIPNRRQRKLERIAFDTPEIKCEHLSK